MQCAKDSFYVALRDRLAALRPERTVSLQGAARPAVIISENEPVAAAPPLADAYGIRWGACVMVASAARCPVFRLEVTIEYRTRGTAEQSGVDRGRALAALDLDLAQILSPRFTPKKDYAQTPPLDLGSAVLWSAPEFGPPQAHDAELRRSVKISLLFWPEVELP